MTKHLIMADAILMKGVRTQQCEEFNALGSGHTLYFREKILSCKALIHFVHIPIGLVGVLLVKRIKNQFAFT